MPTPPATPDSIDFFGIHAMLTDEQRAAQTMVARFVDDRVIPLMPDAFDTGRFPVELIPEIAKLGLLGYTINGHGCAHGNYLTYGLINQELERGDSAIRTFVSVQGSLCMYPIMTFGTAEQQQRWIPPMAKGEIIGCFGLSEAGGGSDPSVMTTTARRDGDDWIINGSKKWITNGTIADVAIVWAATDDGIRGFLVEKDMKGYTSCDITQKFSLRASVTSDLFFDNVRVPSSNMLAGVRGLKGPLNCLSQARYGIAWGAIGAAQACLSEVLAYTKNRELFGRPLSHTQSIQLRLADMCRRITTGQLLAWQLGCLKDAGTLHHSQVSMAKWNNVRLAIDIARDARDMLGANGVSVKLCAMRHMLNLESVITYEGTQSVHQFVVGRELTGHAAF